MRLLALETATEACSVALYLDGEVLERHEIAPRRHAELVLPWIDDLLAQAGVSKSQLDAVACGRGPGAFTGVRLAVALTQGLALALDRPAIGISTLQALALPVMRFLDAVDDQTTRVLSATDARMAEVYWGEYWRDGSGAWECHSGEAVIAPRELGPAGPHAYRGVGTGFAAENGALIETLGARLVHADASALPHAADVARLAAVAYERGEGLLAPEDLQPAYLRNKVAFTLAERGKPVPTPAP